MDEALRLADSVKKKCNPVSSVIYEIVLPSGLSSPPHYRIRGGEGGGTLKAMIPKKRKLQWYLKKKKSKKTGFFHPYICMFEIGLLKGERI